MSIRGIKEALDPRGTFERQSGMGKSSLCVMCTAQEVFEIKRKLHSNEENTNPKCVGIMKARSPPTPTEDGQIDEKLWGNVNHDKW